MGVQKNINIIYANNEIENKLINRIYMRKKRGARRNNSEIKTSVCAYSICLEWLLHDTVRVNSIVFKPIWK